MWSNQAPATLYFPAGVTSGQRVVVGYDPVQNAVGIFAYDANNNLVFALDNTGVQPVLFLPTVSALGDPGTIQWNDSATGSGSLHAGISTIELVNSTWLQMSGGQAAGYQAGNILISQADATALAQIQMSVGGAGGLLFQLKNNGYLGQQLALLAANGINENAMQITQGSSTQGAAYMYVNDTEMKFYDNTGTLITSIGSANGITGNATINNLTVNGGFTVASGASPVQFQGGLTVNGLLSANMHPDANSSVLHEERYGSVGLSFNATNVATATVNWANPFSATPTCVICTPDDGANYDLVCTARFVSTSSFQVRAITRSGANITGNATVYYIARR